MLREPTNRMRSDARQAVQPLLTPDPMSRPLSRACWAILALPLTAHAHAIHPIWVVGALSPLLILLLTVVLAWLARSVRLGVAHGTLVITWVVLFWLASNFVTNDYLIWAPLAAYLVHSVIILALVICYAFKRATSKGIA